jgi:hypothetical protein
MCVFSLVVWPARADDPMTQFLKSCAYGTLAGAGLGLVTLSVSENPNRGGINQVARGASLGLYAGIAWGIYQSRNEANLQAPQEGAQMSPLFNDKLQLDGALVTWNTRFF